MYELDDSNFTPLADFPVYVNIRNERRFFRDTPIKNAQQKGDRDNAIQLSNEAAAGKNSPPLPPHQGV